MHFSVSLEIASHPYVNPFPLCSGGHITIPIYGKGCYLGYNLVNTLLGIFWRFDITFHFSRMQCSQIRRKNGNKSINQVTKKSSGHQICTFKLSIPFLFGGFLIILKKLIRFSRLLESLFSYVQYALKFSFRFHTNDIWIMH
ncbi:uncharacterized protein LOC113319718 isoform X2 [Papaver somniferum]|nr:uncharacterized protein LOC113319718 isoform X2 [Papaver somniferum]